MNATSYRVEELLPHAGPMVLLDVVVSVTTDEIHARVRARGDGLFGGAREGGVPAWLGRGYLVQAIAAWSGFHARERGDP